MTKTDRVRAALEAALSDDQPYIDRCKEALSELDGMVLLPERGSYKFTECADLELLEERQACIITSKIAPYVKGGVE